MFLETKFYNIFSLNFTFSTSLSYLLSDDRENPLLSITTRVVETVTTIIIQFNQPHMW